MRAIGRLGIHEGEARLALLLFALFLAGGAGRAFTRTVAYAGFLDRFPAAAIPAVYIATGLLLVGLMPAYLRVAARTTAAGLAVVTFTGLAVVQGGLWVARISGGGAVIDLVLPVWYEMITIVASLVMWAVAGSTLDLAQGKRLFGLVGAGFPLAFLLTGIVTPGVVSLVGTDVMLLLGVLAMLWAAVLSAGLRGRRGATTAGRSGWTPAAPGERPEPVRALLRNRYVLILVGLTVCWTLAFYLTDFIFYERTAARYDDEASLAAFMGTYSAAMGGLTLVMGLLVTRRLLARFGVRPMAYALPATLGAGALVVALAGSVLGPVGALFWPAFATKVGNYAVDSVDRSTRTTLAQPLPPATRLRVQALGEGVFGPVTAVVAGLLLLLGTAVLGAGAVEAAWALLVVVVGWLFLAAAAGRSYGVALVESLKRRRLTPGVVVPDRDSLLLLRRSLSDPQPDLVLYTLRQLIDIADPEVPAHVSTLLSHPAPPVRLEALRWYGTGSVRPPTDLLRRLAADDPDAAVRGAAGALLVVHGTDADRDRLATTAVESPAGPATTETAVALAAHGTGPQRDAAAIAATAWSASPDPQERLQGLLVRALGIGDRLAWHGVVDIAVGGPQRRATHRAVAARAAAAVAGHPLGRTAVATALREARTEGDEARMRALSRLAVACGPTTADALARHIDHPDARVRSRVLEDLYRLRWHPGAEDRQRVEAQVRIELATARITARAAAGLEVDPAAGPHAELLRRALQLEALKQVHRLLCLLVLLDEPGLLNDAYRAFRAGGRATLSQRRASLAGVVEAVAGPALAEVVAGILAGQALPVRLRALQRALGEDRHDPGPQDVAALVPHPGVSPWTRLTAAWWCGAGPAPSHAPGGPVLTTVERVVVLKQVRLFGQVPDDAVASVAAASQEVELVADTLLFARGDTAEAMYVVVSGRLRVHDGRRTITMLGSREVVGEMALLDDDLRSASVTAVEDTLLLSLDREAFAELMADHPEIARGVIRVLTARLRERTADLLAVPDRGA